jgi:hypothetical protein
MYRDGKKPPSSKVMFDLLGRRPVLVRTTSGDELIFTLNVRKMRGTATDTFQVPPGTKDHTEFSPLVMFQNETMEWHTLDYSDVMEVPFWKAMLEGKLPSETVGTCNTCYEDCKKLMTCGRCGVAQYCSKACQKADWKGSGGYGVPRRNACPRLTKT